MTKLTPNLVQKRSKFDPITRLSVHFARKSPISKRRDFIELVVTNYDTHHNSPKCKIILDYRLLLCYHPRRIVHDARRRHHNEQEQEVERRSLSKPTGATNSNRRYAD